MSVNMVIYFIIFTLITILYIISILYLSKSKTGTGLPSPIAIQLLVNQMSDSFIVLNQNNNISDFNETFIKTFNLDGKHIENMQIEKFLKEIKTPADDINRLSEIIKKVKTENKPISFEHEFSNLHKTFEIEVTPINFNEDIIGILFLFKDVTQHIQDMNELKEHRKLLTEKLEKTYVEVIQTIQHTVEAKDPYTRGHSKRVSEYSMLIGKKLGLSEDEISLLRIGGLFHDVGKIGIPDIILQKDGKLTDEEYEEIKKHPLIGAHILSSSSIFEDIIPIVRFHHERFDGKGYPDGLSGEDIPYLARITAIADSFDAMSSKRIYRNSLPLEKVIQEIENNKGTQFDPQIADVFLGILKNDYDKIKEISK